MTLEKMLELAKNNLKNIIFAGLVLGALSFLILVLSQKSYSATADLLVVQNQQGFSDYYALSKSSDYLSGILMESVYSEKFLEEIGKANLVSTNFLPADKVDRLKEWQKTVKLKKNSSVGIITVQVFANSPKLAGEISSAVIDVLTNKYSLFLGQGQNVEIRVLSGPIVEKNPTLGQIFLVSFSGFVVGFILAFMLVYCKSQCVLARTEFRTFGKNTFMHNTAEDRANDLSGSRNY